MADVVHNARGCPNLRVTPCDREIEMRVVWACRDCGYEWLYSPVADEACPQCSGEPERVDPLLVAMADLLEEILDSQRAKGSLPVEPGD